MPLTLDMIMEAVAADAFIGFCIACGTQHDGVDTDARREHCDACGKPKVYGAEEILLMITA